MQETLSQQAEKKTRSRVGCLECRHHKKKCTEEKPICARCERLSKECMYDREGKVKNRPRKSKGPVVETDEAPLPAAIPAAAPIRSHLSPYSSYTSLSSVTTINTSSIRGVYEHNEHEDVFPTPTVNTVPLSSNGPATEVRHNHAQSNDSPEFITRAASSSGISSPFPWLHFSASSYTPAVSFDRSPSPGPFNSYTDRPLYVNEAHSTPENSSGVYDGNTGEVVANGGCGGDGVASSSKLNWASTNAVSYDYHHSHNSALVLTSTQSTQPFPPPVDSPEYLEELFRVPSPASSPYLAPPIISLLPKEQLELLHHFVSVTTSIGIALDTDQNPLRKFYLPLALSTTDSASENPAYHALLCASATHRMNLMLSTGSPTYAEFKDKAAKHKVLTIRLLANVLNQIREEDLGKDLTVLRSVVAGTMALFNLTSVMDGDTRMYQVPIQSCRNVLVAPYLEFSADQPATPPSSPFRFAIMISSIYELLGGFTNGICKSSEKPASLPIFLPPEDPSEEVDLSSVFGVTQDTWGLAKKTLGLVHRQDLSKVSKDLVEVMIIQADGLELEAEIQAAIRMDVEVASGDSARVSVGSQLLRYALRIFLLTEIFEIPPQDYRIQNGVKAVLGMLMAVPTGQEVGLLLALVIAAASAIGKDRVGFDLFVKRSGWSGRAGPKYVAKILTEVWKDEGKSWREVAVELGSPVLV